MLGRPYILHEATLPQLQELKPTTAVLPWGATEAHNFHLPHGTDVVEAASLAERAGQIAFERGAKVVVLPAIPFGNNEQQLDQVATISFSTATAAAILNDVARSLTTQKIDRLILLNAHGGNEFKPLVRDVQHRFGMLVIVINFFQMKPDLVKATFKLPDDHAGEMETSLLLHLRPDWVDLKKAGEGKRLPFDIEGLTQVGVWTPRPWQAVHPDTGSGDPRHATAEKGRTFFEALSTEIANVIYTVATATKGQTPYL
jgi:creatinine amidohydrolase